jgi:N-acetylglucosamine-6-phosphate deacetylase
LAAELPGADDLARCAVERGIAVSIGHSLYTTADLDRLADAGATALTHFGNGIPNMLPRHDNPLWVGLAHDAYTAMCITDGHHLPAPVIKTVARAKGADKYIVVSDASPVAGLPPGHYHFLDNDAILEPSGLFHNPEKQCLVGSSATMQQCMAHLARLGELSSAELHRVGVTNPLALIGIDHNVDEIPVV